MLRPTRCPWSAVLALTFALAAVPSTAAGEDQPDGEEGERAELPTASYLKLHPDFVVNLRVAPEADPHMLLAAVQVMSRSRDTLLLAYDHLPALRHRLLMLFGDQSYPRIRRPEARVELQELALEELNEVLLAELGPAHQFEGLYFSDFVIE